MKSTEKYRRALQCAKDNNVHIADGASTYSALQQAGFKWIPQQATWIKQSSIGQDQPSELIRIRVWADQYMTKQVADIIGLELSRYLQLVDRSEEYPCRPPKQLETRIYLSFRKKGNL